MANTSKNQIRKLGKAIKKEHIPSVANLEKLQEYRTSFKDTVSDVFTNLTFKSKKVYTESISSFRLKRIDTIIRKLHRYNGMELDRMWDIAGCRFIMKNERQIKKLAKQIEKEYFILESQTRNYYSQDSGTGYKALHLYIRKEKNDFFTIEIQIKTLANHNWATLVEITDLLYDDDAKETHNIKKTIFGEFHLLLSKNTSKLSGSDKIKMLNIAIKNDLYSKLSSIFIKNYIEVRVRWESEIRDKKKSYFIIETKKDDFPTIISYAKYEDAENEYFNRYSQKNNSNILLTHLANVNYNQISTAYSNYILTMHSFFYDFINTLQEMITYTVDKRKIFLLNKYFSEYIKILNSFNKELSMEYKAISKPDNNINKTTRKQWERELNTRIIKIKTEQKKFIKQLTNVYPKYGIYPFIFNFIIKRAIEQNNKNN